MVKNCDQGLENAAQGCRRLRAACHSFSPYGPTLSRQITYLFFSCDKLALRNFELVTLLLNWLTCRLQTSERANERVTQTLDKKRCIKEQI